MRVKHLIELLQKEVEKDPLVAELRLVAEFDCYGSIREDEVRDIKLVRSDYNENRGSYVWDQPDGKFLSIDIWPFHVDGSEAKHTYE